MSSSLAVYVHIPFCTVKCGYCDFNAYAGLDSLKDAYAAALLDEIAADASLFAGRTISSVAFGGGTPGEVPPADIAAVLDALRGQASFAEGAEVSLEANPGTTTGAQLHELRAAGVTRISFGAQSFHADELRFLDRIHSPEASAASLQLAREAGFSSVGLDLIYGLPGQQPAPWLDSLSQAIDLSPDHISTYALTIEDGTPLARRVRTGEVTPLDDDSVATLYELGGELLASGGYEQYEISNWARPGHHSRHNSTYWTDGDYLQLGAGAHGYLTGERFENIANPGEYVNSVAANPGTPHPAVCHRYRPDTETAMSDWLGMRLRLLDGFENAAFRNRFGVSLEEAVGPVLADCAAAGVLELAPRIRLTRAGRLLHGEVAARFLAHLQS